MGQGETAELAGLAGAGPGFFCKFQEGESQQWLGGTEGGAMSQEGILEALLWPGNVSDSHAPTASNGHPTHCLAGPMNPRGPDQPVHIC